VGGVAVAAVHPILFLLLLLLLLGGLQHRFLLVLIPIHHVALSVRVHHLQACIQRGAQTGHDTWL
jgi:hypothetical protein